MPIRSWFVLWLAPPAVALVVGAFILARRYCSRRATGLAGMALCVLAGEWLFRAVQVFGPDHWFPNVSSGSAVSAVMVVATAREVLHAGCIVLLVCAVVADRWPVKASGPEADYRDPPAG
jgi:hypothetical protein